MNVKKLTNAILKDVLPFAAQRVSLLTGIKYNPDDLIIDSMTLKSMVKVYKNYINLLFECSHLSKIVELMIVDRVSDFELIDCYSDLYELVKMINKLRELDITTKSVGIKYIIIKWGFLPIFEDILYAKNLELPITMPSYFSAFYMIYNDNKVWEALKDIPGSEEEEDTIKIRIMKRDPYKEESLLLEMPFLIEGSMLEGMYTYAHIHKKNFKFFEGSIHFYLGKEEIKFKNYVLKKKSLLAEKYEGILPRYSSIIEPFGIIVNFEQPTFVIGFNTLNEIMKSTIFICNENIVNNTEEVEYVKT